MECQEWLDLSREVWTTLRDLREQIARGEEAFFRVVEERNFPGDYAPLRAAAREYLDRTAGLASDRARPGLNAAEREAIEGPRLLQAAVGAAHHELYEVAGRGVADGTFCGCAGEHELDRVLHELSTHHLRDITLPVRQAQLMVQRAPGRVPITR